MNITKPLLLLMLALPLAVNAAEEVTPATSTDAAPTETPAAATANVNDTPAADADAEAADATGGTLAADETFVPTVEISEDLSVSFPTDI